MNLDAVLGENLLALGFRLKDEDHRLYLTCKGEDVAVLNGWTATVRQIKDAARAWLNDQKEV